MTPLLLFQRKAPKVQQGMFSTSLLFYGLQEHKEVINLREKESAHLVRISFYDGLLLKFQFA